MSISLHFFMCQLVRHSCNEDEKEVNVGCKVNRRWVPKNTPTKNAGQIKESFTVTETPKEVSEQSVQNEEEGGWTQVIHKRYTMSK